MEITASVVNDFRSYYPEFSDSAVFSDAELTRYLQDADQETGSSRWGAYAASPPNLKARGLFAYAAHQAVLARARRKAVENGQVPGAPATVESKSVGDESVSYAVGPAETGARADVSGNLGSTYYGQEFRRLRHRAGSGGTTTGGVTL